MYSFKHNTYIAYRRSNVSQNMSTYIYKVNTKYLYKVYDDNFSTCLLFLLKRMIEQSNAGLLIIVLQFDAIMYVQYRDFFSFI